MIFFICQFPDLFDLCHERVVGLIGFRNKDNFVVTQIYEFENKSYSPQDCFFVGKDQYIKICKKVKEKNLSFLGIIHTHLPQHNFYPSEKDYKTAKNNMINGVLFNNKLTFYNKAGIIETRKIKKINLINFFLFKIFELLK